MIITERFIRWKPIFNNFDELMASSSELMLYCSTWYSLQSISYNKNSLKLKLQSGDLNNQCEKINDLYITFENSVISYRCTNESLRLLNANNICDQLHHNSHDPWVFLKVINSVYIKNLIKISNANLDYSALMHFSIIELNSVIDVIATHEPKIELIQVSNIETV